MSLPELRVLVNLLSSCIMSSVHIKICIINAQVKVILYSQVILRTVIFKVKQSLL